MIDLAVARDLVSASRARVVRSLPYFSTPILALRPFPLAGLGTMGVDAHSRMAYDPECVVAWGVGTTATIVLHEALHVLFDHHKRQNGRRHRKWNVAADCEINRVVLDAGFEFPKGFNPVTAESFGLDRGLSAEEYYDLLPENAGEGLEGALPGCGGACGDVAGNPQGWEDKADELSDGLVGQSPTDQESMRHATAEMVSAETANGRGKVPSGLSLWSTLRLMPPVVPWTDILPSLVRNALASKTGADDYTRSRPSRRSYGMVRAFGPGTPVLPGLRSPAPKVAVILDTSGSMRGKPVERGAAEVYGVVKALGMPIKAYAVDAAVHVAVNVMGENDVVHLGRGGGGTDMCKGIDRAMEDRPDVIVVITDGATPWPTEDKMPSRARIVAAVIGHAAVPPYLTAVVRVPLEEKE